ncbi:hypothetical protein V6N11_003817 [Hibiscus sabdariffa]|uniref:Uncharacterized protein n=1 Tax=Hibiscus sabdariffa TaxID=183260 RepID=A0ABR2SF37_9ROSI
MPSEIPRQTQKHKQVKAHFGSSSSQGFLPLLEKIVFNGINPHAVRRTPPVPVSYSYGRDEIESYGPPKKRAKKSETDDNGRVASEENKKIISGDESTSLSALLTLANLSTTLLPTSTVASDSSSKLKENRTTCETDEGSSASISHHLDKTNYVGPKEKVPNLNTGAEDGTSSESKVESYSATVDNVVSEPKLQLEPTNNSKKRKSKSFSASQDVAEEVCNT